MLKPLHNLCNSLQKVCGILTICHVSRVAPRGHPAVDKSKLGPQHAVLSELIKTLSQTKKQLKMVGKNSRWLGKNTTPLQLVLKVMECSAAIPLHEFCFEKTFNGISSHIHGITPAPGVEQRTGIIQTVCACPGWFAYASVEVM
jgi:hypothetical protein